MNRLLMMIFLANIFLAGCTKSENENAQQTRVNPENVKSQPAKENPETNIEQLVDNKVAESIKFLNEESRRSSEGEDDYYKYALSTKKIIKSDLNHDGKPDYVVAANFCEETSCHLTTSSNEFLIFTTDSQNKINFITDTKLGIIAEIDNVDDDGVITIKNNDYAENDPSCCPSIVKSNSYALVGKRLRLLAE